MEVRRNEGIAPEDVLMMISEQIQAFRNIVKQFIHHHLFFSSGYRKLMIAILANHTKKP